MVTRYICFINIIFSFFSALLLSRKDSSLDMITIKQCILESNWLFIEVGYNVKQFCLSEKHTALKKFYRQLFKLCHFLLVVNMVQVSLSQSITSQKFFYFKLFSFSNTHGPFSFSYNFRIPALLLCTFYLYLFKNMYIIMLQNTTIMTKNFDIAQIMSPTISLIYF